MRILLTIGSFNPAHGGPYFSVGNLTKALAANGGDVRLFTADYPHLPVQHAPEGVALSFVKAKLIPGIRQSWIPGCARELDALIEEFGPDVIHDNGLWLTLNHQIAKAAKRHGIPFVLSLRGCLDPWAMSYRNWKKKIALGLYQRKDLESVTCFHAASELEAESIRKMGLLQPIAVIPNGIDIPEWAAQGAGGRGQWVDSMLHAPSSVPACGVRYALFMGRLHPIKNLPTLLRAWAVVKPEGWVLRLVGSDEVDHRAELEGLARELGISDRVEFLGPKYGTEKEELFRSSELAFLVSHSENFGIAAAEALGYGIPVIASKSTPWECLETEKIGWWVEGDVQGVSQGFRLFLGLSEEERISFTERAVSYSCKKFGWEAIAERFGEFYASTVK